jgi:WD40 repeat protein
VAFSPDGQTLATGDVDKTIGMWRVSDGTLLDVLTGNADFIFSVDFSPSGKQVASGAMDGTVRIWNLSAGYLFSPGVTTTAWVGDPAPQDCKLCHHPGWNSQPALVTDINCKTCHTQGASLYWDPNIPREIDPVTGKLSNGTP